MLSIGYTLEDRWRRMAPGGKWLTRLAGLLLFVLIGWQIGAAFFPPKKPAPTAPVTVAKATTQDVPAREHAVGTVVADATVNVTARVGGQIVAIAFKEGQDVRKGDVLFRLDPRPLQAAVAQAQATLERDRATLAYDQQEAARNVALAAQKAVSVQTRDSAVATAHAAAATVAADRAALDTAKLDLDYAAIRAPIDGKTGAIAVQIGNLVVANATTALVTIAKDRPVKVSFALPQDRIAKLQKQLRAGKLLATVTADGSDETRTVPVDFIGNAVSESTGTIELRATIPNADRNLVPGQMVSVDVALETLHKATVIPTNAVNQGPNQNYVFVIKDGVAKQVPVRVLYGNETISAVKGDLRPGDLVITDGQLRVVDGAKVRIVGHGAGKRALSSPGAQ